MQPDSLVDQLWTNSPGLIVSHFNKVRSFSDHNIIGAYIRTKDRKENSHESEMRIRKNFDPEIYKTMIGRIDWKDYFLTENVDKLNDFLVSKIS